MSKSGKELIAEITRNPVNTDLFMDRDPNSLSDADIKDLIVGLRWDRTRFKAKDEGKLDKEPSDDTGN